ncbi:MAG: hypothetical protein O2819_06500 [Planctomycetota bacterium]|nr:hypothetical protein [Planctomycetota bacterium]MDA1105236.1 hypothetical protein [Planctomycetota bacterium]
MKTVALIPVDPAASGADITTARALLDGHDMATLVVDGSTANVRFDADWLVTDDAAWVAAAADATRTIVVHQGSLHSDLDPDFVAGTFADAARRILRAEALDGSPRWMPVGEAHLAALHKALDDPRHRALIEASATALAERTGVSLVGLSVDEGGVTARVIGSNFVAIGLLTELRRTTAEWARKHGVGPWWRE